MAKRKQKPKPEKINRIKKQFLVPAGMMSFRYITVYEDHSITVGSEQRLDKVSILEVMLR